MFGLESVNATGFVLFQLSNAHLNLFDSEVVVNDVRKFIFDRNSSLVGVS